MKRNRWLIAFALGTAITLPACELVLDADEEPGQWVPLPDSDPLAEAIGHFNRDVLPLLNLRCDPCHDGSLAGLNFSGPPGSLGDGDPFFTVYDRVKAWPALVNVEEPGMSRLITKGLHEGPAWNSEELNSIIPWLIRESELAQR